MRIEGTFGFTALFLGFLSFAPSGLWAQEEVKAENPAIEVASQVADVKALKLFIATLSVANREDSILSRKLRAILEQDLKKAEEKYHLVDGSISVASVLASDLTITMGLSTIMTGMVGDGGLAKIGGRLFFGVLIADLAIMSGQGSRNSYLKKDGDKLVEKEHVLQVMKTNKLEPTPSFSLLSKALDWTPAQEQKFLDAYRNVVAGSYAVSIDPGPASGDFGSDQRTSIKHGESSVYYAKRFWAEPRPTAEGILNIIETHDLASKDQLEALRKIADAEKAVQSLSHDKEPNKYGDWTSNYPAIYENEGINNAARGLQAKLAGLKQIKKALDNVAADSEVLADPQASKQTANLRVKFAQAIEEIEDIQSLSVYRSSP